MNVKNSYDIFISYAHKDGEIAASLASRFDDAGLRCFLADKSILAASEWDTVLRDALRSADRILVLLTPRSKDSLWVAAEIGAAWVLGKEFIPALMFVGKEDLLEPVQKYQARTVETPQQIEALVREIKASSAERFRAERSSPSRGVSFSTTRSASLHAGPHESFTSLADGERLLKVGEWKFDAKAGELVGEGMFRYVLSHQVYGPGPFTVDCRLTFLDLRPEGSIDAVNAGIVLGWSTPGVARQYFNLTFSGRGLFLEKIGFRGQDEYADFEHLSPEVPFHLEENVAYDFSVRVQPDRLLVFCNGHGVFETAVEPGSIAGRVGLRPWRSRLSCQRFNVQAEG